MGEPHHFIRRSWILCGATAWLLAYIVAHLDVIVLRRRHPGLARPYHSRWLPWPQWFGIAAMVYCLFHVSPEPALAGVVDLYAGAVLGLVALAAMGWVSWFNGVDCSGTVRFDNAPRAPGQSDSLTTGGMYV